MADTQKDITQTNLEVVRILQEARDEVELAYGNGESFQAHKLRITSNLDRQIRSLANLEGLSHNVASEQIKFQPVTDFMGEKIVVRSNYNNVESANPNLNEIEQFQKKVEDLYISIPGIPYEKIKRDYSGNSNMELVLRGVAKQAGVQNYEDAGLTEEFYTAILNGIAKNNAEDEFKQQQEDTFNASLKDQPPVEKIVLSDAHLIVYPELREKGYKAGDEIDKTLLQSDLSSIPAIATPALVIPPAANQDVKDIVSNDLKAEAQNSTVVTEPSKDADSKITGVTVVEQGGVGYEGQDTRVVTTGSDVRDTLTITPANSDTPTTDTNTATANRETAQDAVPTSGAPLTSPKDASAKETAKNKKKEDKK